MIQEVMNHWLGEMVHCGDSQFKTDASSYNSRSTESVSFH